MSSRTASDPGYTEDPELALHLANCPKFFQFFVSEQNASKISAIKFFLIDTNLQNNLEFLSLQVFLAFFIFKLK